MQLVTAASLAGTLLLGAAESPRAAAEDVARRVEERQRNVQDLQARFVQTYRSGVLGREIVESGTVSIKRPGRMRWDYRKPEPKTFVSDGKVFYFTLGSPESDIWVAELVQK